MEVAQSFVFLVEERLDALQLALEERDAALQDGLGGPPLTWAAGLSRPTSS